MKTVHKALALGSAAVLIAGFGLWGVFDRGTAASTMSAHDLLKLCRGESINTAGTSSATVTTENTMYQKATTTDATAARSCYTEFFGDRMRSTDPSEAVRLLGNYASQTDGLAGECHTVAHELGSLAWDRYQLAALKADPQTCSFGFGHGLLKAASLDLGQSEMLANFTDLCTENMEQSNCLHGMGHALAETDTQPALVDAICESQSKNAAQAELNRDSTWDLHYTCMAGWVMEDAFMNPSIWSNYNTPESAVSRCSQLVGVGAAACTASSLKNYALIQPSNANYVAGLREHRLMQFSTYCSSATGDMGISCAREIGAALAEAWSLGTTGSAKVAALATYCPQGIQDSCLTAMLSNLASRTSFDSPVVTDICQSLGGSQARNCRTFLDSLRAPKVAN